MAANIGGVSCKFVKGNPQTLTPRVSTWQVAGLDGYGAQTLGKGDGGFTFRAIFVGTEAEVETWFADLEALRGELVAAENDWELTFENILVVSLGPRLKTAIIGDDGEEARGERLVECIQT